MPRKLETEVREVRASRENVFGLMLRNREAFVTTLLLIAADTVGFDGLEDRDPEGLVLDLQEAYNVEIPEINRHRLGAGLVLLKTDLFYADLPSHVHLSQILFGEPLETVIGDLPSIAEEAWAFFEASMIMPEDYLDPQIVQFIENLAEETGFTVLPKFLIRNLPPGVQLVHPVDAAGIEDPEVYGAVFYTGKQRADAVDAIMLDRVNHYLNQIAILPIENANSEVLEKIRQQAERVRDEFGKAQA